MRMLRELTWSPMRLNCDTNKECQLPMSRLVYYDPNWDIRCSEISASKPHLRKINRSSHQCRTSTLLFQYMDIAKWKRKFYIELQDLHLKERQSWIEDANCDGLVQSVIDNRSCSVPLATLKASPFFLEVDRQWECYGSWHDRQWG